MKTTLHWWLAWFATTLLLTSYFSFRLWVSEDRSLFLPGPSTHGHYQIELACNACHTPKMGVREQSCLDCHAANLEVSNDTHRPKKFADPRNADRLEAINAVSCLTCHREHKLEITRASGLTLPTDYCYSCHKKLAADRPSHAGLGFNTCTTAGCHNYHDNTALYEDFLLKHLHQPACLEDGAVLQRDLLAWLDHQGKKTGPALSLDQHDTPDEVLSRTTGHTLQSVRSPKAAASPGAAFDQQILEDWAATAHARAGINCTDCHHAPDDPAPQKVWVNRPDHHTCAACHEAEVKGFLMGKHGMRLAQDLSPMKPRLARLPMKPDAFGRELGCTSCHSAHRFDTRQAAVESCLACHDDTHSLAYKDSPHYRLWTAETTGGTGHWPVPAGDPPVGTARRSDDNSASSAHSSVTSILLLESPVPPSSAPPGSGVSCATCHLPRQIQQDAGHNFVRVQHNQNRNLRPNEKMIRDACLHCHGLGYSINALADPALIDNNFSAQPSVHVESLEMAERRRQHQGEEAEASR